MLLFSQRKSKERDYNYGSGPEQEATVGVGGFPCLDIYCISKEPGILEACRKGTLTGFWPLLLLPVSCPHAMPGCL